MLSSLGRRTVQLGTIQYGMTQYKTIPQTQIPRRQFVPVFMTIFIPQDEGPKSHPDCQKCRVRKSRGDRFVRALLWTSGAFGVAGFIYAAKDGNDPVECIMMGVGCVLYGVSAPVSIPLTGIYWLCQRF